MRMRTIVTAVILVGLAVASAHAEQLVGKGEWKSLSGDVIGGSWAATIVQNAGGVNGSLTLTGSNVFAGGDVTGTVDAASIVLGLLNEQGKQATFSAKIDGTSIKGEWNSDLLNDHGVWYGTLEPVISAGVSGAP